MPQIKTPPSKFNAAPTAVPGLPPLRKIPGRERLVKDVLRTGRWVVGFNEDGTPTYWNATSADLIQLATRFKEHLAAGFAPKLCYDHPPGDFPFPSAASCIADIAEVWTDGKTLWMGLYVPPETKAMLTSQRHQVSIGTVREFIDGTGRKWPGQSLAHVAVVGSGVVPAQQPFMNMGLPKTPASQQREKSGKSLAIPKDRAGDDRYSELLSLIERMNALVNPDSRGFRFDWPPEKFLNEFEKIVKAWEKNAGPPKAVAVALAAAFHRVASREVRPGCGFTHLDLSRLRRFAPHSRPRGQSLKLSLGSMIVGAGGKPKPNQAAPAKATDVLIDFDKLSVLMDRAYRVLTGKDCDFVWQPVNLISSLHAILDGMEGDDGSQEEVPLLVGGDVLQMGARNRPKRISDADLNKARKLRGLPEKPGSISLASPAKPKPKRCEAAAADKANARRLRGLPPK